MDLFTLVAKIGLDSKEYEQGIQKAKNDAHTAAQSIGRSSESVKNAAKEAGEGIKNATKGTESATKTTTERNKTLWERMFSAVESNGKSKMESLSAWTLAKAKLLADGIKSAFSKIFDIMKKAIVPSADKEALDSLASQTFGKLESAASGALDTISKDTNILAGRLKGVGTSSFMQFRSAGVDAAEAISMMDKYVRLAADGAAAYNISVEDADVRLRSFLRGNVEAGDSIGLQISESTRASKALEVYGKKWSELTEAQKQNLLLNVVDEMYTASGVIRQAAREGHEWETVVGNLNSALYGTDGIMPKIGESFRTNLIPAIEKATAFLTDETIQMRAGMLASSLADATGWVFDGIIDLLDKILEWSSGDEEFKIDIHIPTWEEIQTTAETALTTIQNGIKGFATWTLGAFTLDGVSIPEILQTAKTWWSGQGANAYERLKSVFTWTLGNFVAPSVEGFFDDASTWWEETAQPALTAITQWSFGELIVPAWGDFALSVKNWWMNDFLPSMTAILTWNLGDLKLPSIEDVQEKISTWWNTVKAGLKLSFSASYSRTFSQAELEQGQNDYKDEIDAISSPSLAPWSNKKNAPSKATGLDYVPYDNFVAKLHAGETVLNRADATAYRAGNVGGISAESISQAVAVAVREALDGVGVYMGADRVGDLVTQRVSRNIAKGARAMRYANV